MEYQKKKVKLITYIDHKSDLGGKCSPPQKKFSFFLSVGHVTKNNEMAAMQETSSS